MHAGLTSPRAGTKIGLLGGSFDPPHGGHLHITRHALRRFGLDNLWWLVSPGNPLKAKGPAPLKRRMTSAKKLIRESKLPYSKVVVTDLETQLDTRYTADTLYALIKRYPSVAFVWLMGADNLASFHKWERWRWIMSNVPVGVLARPGYRAAAQNSQAALEFRHARLNSEDSLLLSVSPPPCWCFVNIPMVKLSSSYIRACGGRPRSIRDSNHQMPGTSAALNRGCMKTVDL